MEGNDCYKFSTIRSYIEATGAPPVRVVVEAGVNVGSVTRLVKAYFPEAAVFGLEVVRELAGLARANTRDLAGVRILTRALTAEHLYEDDAGTRPRASPTTLRLLRGTPRAGPGWAGGSTVVPASHPLVGDPGVRGLEGSSQRVRPITLEELLAAVRRRTGSAEVDILKMDCEQCEHSSLGCAAEETLRRLRFIVGEYHGIQRFWRVLRDRLFRTHKVSLIGDAELGAFFAERRDGEKDGILRHDNAGMLQLRPWLSDEPMEWHLFNERYVLPDERSIHALA
ncbi:MAG TPA: FkbM family methyltransferase [Longimicrobium sp.]|nr:FkbM family methyltransferase [Longimicrobium sp.]